MFSPFHLQPKISTLGFPHPSVENPSILLNILRLQTGRNEGNAPKLARRIPSSILLRSLGIPDPHTTMPLSSTSIDSASFDLYLPYRAPTTPLPPPPQATELRAPRLARVIQLFLFE